MERKSRKIYYTMGEVSEMFDVNPSLIRFWEQKFDILKPDKNKKGNRLFSPRDVENLKLIYHLVKENGMTLAGAAKRLRENREGIERNLEIIEKLQRMRAMLVEVREALKAGDGREVFVDTDPTDETETDNPGEFFRPEADAAVGTAGEAPDGKPASRSTLRMTKKASSDEHGELSVEGDFRPAEQSTPRQAGNARPVATDEGLEAGPPVPPFIQREIPVPPQPVPSTPAAPPVAPPEPPQAEPKEVSHPSIVEQTLF